MDDYIYAILFDFHILAFLPGLIAFCSKEFRILCKIP